MDCFAVSISYGITITKLHIKYALRIALFFGVFQAMMPVIGWFAGLSVRNKIAAFDHWVAFGLLSFVGGKMIYQAIGTEEQPQEKGPMRIGILLLLAIATSVDALAIGLTFAFLEVSIIYPVLVIGVVAFVLSFLGVYLGDRFGKWLGRSMEIVGGLILIGIGVKILVEHLG